MLTASQKREFHKEGYLAVRGVIPKVMVDAARRAINHSIGNMGRGQDEMDKHRVGQMCDDLRNVPVITDLFNKTPVMQIAESLIGEGNVPPVMVTGKAGDFVIAHHQLVHTGGPNTSPNIRYATIARLQHKDCKQNEYEAFTDIWREWPGVREANRLPHQGRWQPRDA